MGLDDSKEVNLPLKIVRQNKRSGRSISVSAPENIDEVNGIFRIRLKRTSETLKISYELVRNTQNVMYMFFKRNGNRSCGRLFYKGLEAFHVSLYNKCTH